jgi:hypothetical protein
MIELAPAVVDVQPDEVALCTACADDNPALMARCQETFTCLTCGRTVNCCASMPGWPEAERHDECVMCWEGRVLPRAWGRDLNSAIKVSKAGRGL